MGGLGKYQGVVSEGGREGKSTRCWGERQVCLGEEGQLFSAVIGERN